MSKRTLVVPLLLALGACATVPVSNVDGFASRSANNSFELFNRGVEPPETLVLPVVHDRQTDPTACGAHVLASVINYWRGASVVSGDAILIATPPTNRDGYSMTELMALAQSYGLTASAVRLQNADIVRELENGRPVIVPVRVPSVYVQPWTLPGDGVPVLGFPSAMVTSRVGWISEQTNSAMVNHYVLVVGYEEDTFVVVEPVRGFRTISFDRLARYRRTFGNAAIVLSGRTPPPAQAAAS